jgi:hypothetical protein
VEHGDRYPGALSSIRERTAAAQKDEFQGEPVTRKELGKLHHLTFTPADIEGGRDQCDAEPIVRQAE